MNTTFTTLSIIFLSFASLNARVLTKSNKTLDVPHTKLSEDLQTRNQTDIQIKDIESMSSQSSHSNSSHSSHKSIAENKIMNKINFAVTQNVIDKIIDTEQASIQKLDHQSKSQNTDGSLTVYHHHESPQVQDTHELLHNAVYPGKIDTKTVQTLVNTEIGNQMIKSKDHESHDSSESNKVMKAIETDLVAKVNAKLNKSHKSSESNQVRKAIETDLEAKVNAKLNKALPQKIQLFTAHNPNVDTKEDSSISSHDSFKTHSHCDDSKHSHYVAHEHSSHSSHFRATSHNSHNSHNDAIPHQQHNKELIAQLGDAVLNKITIEDQNTVQLKDSFQSIEEQMIIKPDSQVIRESTQIVAFAVSCLTLFLFF